MIRGPNISTQHESVHAAVHDLMSTPVSDNGHKTSIIIKSESAGRLVYDITTTKEIDISGEKSTGNGKQRVENASTCFSAEVACDHSSWQREVNDQNDGHHHRQLVPKLVLSHTEEHRHFYEAMWKIIGYRSYHGVTSGWVCAIVHWHV